MQKVFPIGFISAALFWLLLNFANGHESQFYLELKRMRMVLPNKGQ